MFVRLASFTHMGGRPLLLTTLIVLSVEVTFASNIIRSIESLAISAAVVWPTAMSEIRAEDEKLTLTWRQDMIFGIAKRL